MGSSAIGHFEQLLLTAILTLEDDAYGVTIHERVAEFCAPKPVTIVPLSILTTSLPGGSYGTSYSQTLKASGGTGTYSWSKISRNSHAPDLP